MFSRKKQYSLNPDFVIVIIVVVAAILCYLQKVFTIMNIFYYGFCIFAESFHIGLSEVGQRPACELLTYTSLCFAQPPGCWSSRTPALV